MPIAGLLVANVDMKVSFTPLSMLYIWPTPTKEWNFASAVSFPLAWLEVEADLSLGPFTVRKKDSAFGLACFTKWGAGAAEMRAATRRGKGLK